jgi:hypothetical protein
MKRLLNVNLRFVENFEVNVEEENVENDRNRDQTKSSSHEVLQGVADRLLQVTQDVPQLLDSICADKKNDKKSDKFDRKCATQHSAR